MNLSLTDVPLPVRLRTETPITDEELLRFCADNDLLRVERDSKRELIVMSPTETEGGFVESDVALELGIWHVNTARAHAEFKQWRSAVGFFDRCSGCCLGKLEPLEFTYLRST